MYRKGDGSSSPQSQGESDFSYSRLALALESNPHGTNFFLSTPRDRLLSASQGHVSAGSGGKAAAAYSRFDSPARADTSDASRPASPAGPFYKGGRFRLLPSSSREKAALFKPSLNAAATAAGAGSGLGAVGPGTPGVPAASGAAPETLGLASDGYPPRARALVVASPSPFQAPDGPCVHFDSLQGASVPVGPEPESMETDSFEFLGGSASPTMAHQQGLGLSGPLVGLPVPAAEAGEGLSTAAQAAQAALYLDQSQAPIPGPSSCGLSTPSGLGGGGGASSAAEAPRPEGLDTFLGAKRKSQDADLPPGLPQESSFQNLKGPGCFMNPPHIAQNTLSIFTSPRGPAESGPVLISPDASPPREKIIRAAEPPSIKEQHRQAKNSRMMKTLSFPTPRAARALGYGVGRTSSDGGHGGAGSGAVSDTRASGSGSPAAARGAPYLAPHTNTDTRTTLESTLPAHLRPAGDLRLPGAQQGASDAGAAGAALFPQVPQGPESQLPCLASPGLNFVPGPFRGLRPVSVVPQASPLPLATQAGVTMPAATQHQARARGPHPDQLGLAAAQVSGQAPPFPGAGAHSRSDGTGAKENLVSLE